MKQGAAMNWVIIGTTREWAHAVPLAAMLVLPITFGSTGCRNEPVPVFEKPVEAWITWADAASGAHDWVDSAYRFDNLNPAYQRSSGPNVCIDEAHFNFHTAEGIYKPFAELLRGDGYRVTRFRSGFTPHALTDCKILLIANATADRSPDALLHRGERLDIDFPVPGFV